MERFFKINIVLKALNLLYSSTEENNEEIINSSVIDYAFLSKDILKNKDYNSFITNYDYENNNYDNFELELKLLFNRNGEDISKFINKEKFQLFPINKIISFSEKYQLIIMHSNPLYIFIDKMILSFFNAEIYFIFMLKDNLQYQIIKSPNKFIIASSLIEELCEYHNLGCWTLLIANYRLNHSENKIVIKEIIERNELSLLKYKPDLVSLSFFNQEYYFDIIKEIILNQRNNNINDEAKSIELEKKIYEINPIRVLVLTSTLLKPFAFTKSLFYISNEKVIYDFFYSEKQIKDNKFDYICVRFNEFQNFSFYKLLLDEINLIQKDKHINNLSFAYKLMNRSELTKIIKDFTIQEEKKKLQFQLKLNNKLNINLNVFKSEDSILTIKEEIKKRFKMKIIVKFTSEAKINYNHLNILIVNNKGWDSFIQDLHSKYSDDNNLMINIEEFLPHESFIYKIFFIAGKAKVFIRPSIPKEIINIIENKGYLTYLTSEIESKNFRIKYGLDLNSSHINNASTFSNISNSNAVSIKIEERMFFEKIALDFSLYSQLSLFGIDVIYSNEAYYIIDINYFPAYSEYKESISQEFIDLFLNVNKN